MLFREPTQAYPHLSLALVWGHFTFDQRGRMPQVSWSVTGHFVLRVVHLSALRMDGARLQGFRSLLSC